MQREFSSPSGSALQFRAYRFGEQNQAVSGKVRHAFDCLLAITLNDGPVGNHTIFRYDDDSVADVVERVIYIFRLAGGSDDAIATDPGVLVDNRIFEECIFPNSNPRTAGHFVLKNGGLGFEVVAPE